MGSRLTLYPKTVLYEWWSNWAGTPMKFWQLRIRACLIWARAYYTCTPLHHVHTKQDTDSKENWKLSGKVQETDGTEKVYVTHSLASKFDSPYSNTSSYSTANVTSWNMQTQALTRCRNLYSGSQLRILKHASLYLHKIPLLEWTLQRRLLSIAIKHQQVNADSVLIHFQQTKH